MNKSGEGPTAGHDCYDSKPVTVEATKHDEAVDVRIAAELPIRFSASIAEQDLATAVRLGVELAEVRAALHAVEDAEAAGLVAAIVAHDANNVISAILGSAELLVRHCDAEGEQLAAEIADGCAHVSAILRALFPSPRRIGAPPISVNAVVEELLPRLIRLANGAAEVTARFDHAVPAVHVHPVDVQRVLVNLIANACEAMTKRGHIVISTRLVHAAPSEGAPSTSAPWLLLAVEDDGAGMDEATLRRVTEPFFTTKGPERGTGLGLASVARVARVADGRLRVESTPNVGTRVQLWLPPASGDRRSR